VEQTDKSIMVRAIGIKHGCAVFNGVDSYISHTSSTLNMTTACTVEATVKLNKLSGFQAIVGKEAQYLIRISGANIQFYFYTTTWVLRQVPLPVNIGTHFHVAMTYDGTTMRSYIDNVPQNPIPTTSSFQGATTHPFQIGRYFTTEYLDGSIDDVRIWDYARTAQQIKDNFNRVLKPQTGLVAYYKLDGNALDSSGNNNHGTVNGGVSWSSSVSPTLQKNIILQSSANRILTK
jgi:hypothetical protein